MNEEELKALLGENFEGAKEFFKNAVLGNGDYVLKGKSDAEKKALQDKLNEANQKLKANMSEDDQRKADAEAKDALIAQLQEQLKGSKISANQATAIGNIAEATTLIGLKSDDKDLVKFIANIATEDAEKTVEVSQYVNKIIKDAYEKGKAEATKQNGEVPPLCAYHSAASGGAESTGRLCPAGGVRGLLARVPADAHSPRHPRVGIRQPVRAENSVRRCLYARHMV